MQRILVHVAMVLLGVTLTVGFYEGRRLAKNTARAFTAATTMSTASTKRSARDERLGLTEGDDAEVDPEGALMMPGQTPQIAIGAEDLASRAMMRDRKAARLVEPGEPGGRRGKRGGGGRRGKRGGPRGLGPSELGAAATTRMNDIEDRQAAIDGGGPPPPAFDDTGAL
ncbi:MAG: hypothetical protein H6735_14630 [Alphaproteobacteria bacterium]|nr:hypothetical protein [Alphaproteobacteria bacterium]